MPEELGLTASRMFAGNQIQPGKYILDMFEDEDEFVTLTVGELLHQIRYIQAAQTGSGIIVQLGIEEGEQTRLVEKECTQEECMNIFRVFYESALVQNLEEYAPVKLGV